MFEKVPRLEKRAFSCFLSDHLLGSLSRKEGKKNGLMKRLCF